jgi:hypothetical protein
LKPQVGSEDSPRRHLELRKGGAGRHRARRFQ